MKLGIFDSGLGGLVIAKAVRERLPHHDLLYYGDTLHVPYGNRSNDAIYEYTKRAMIAMFEKDCGLIVMACNTASAAALRRLQQEWLPEAYPGRNIIGVIVPTLEAALDQGYKSLGLIGTNYIIRSNVFHEELIKIDPAIRMSQKATPLLVPLIENDGLKWAPDILKDYLEPLLAEDIECLILGCTHYPALKDIIRDIIGDQVALLSQDELIPEKLADYLERHPEYDSAISKSGKGEFYVSDLTENYMSAARRIYGSDIKVEQL